MLNVISEDWQKLNFQIFWGELTPCDHVVQIYENDKVFLDSLEGFIGSGLIAGDSIIIIATPEHLIAIKDRLRKQGFDMDGLSSRDQFIGIEVNDAITNFMINKWPDENLFFEFISTLLKRAQKNGRKIRAFGEIVAVLWQQGFNGATVQLEHLWNRLHKNDGFTLFCAYPKIGFTEDINTSIEIICSAHNKIIDGSPRPSTEIYYKSIST